MGLHMLHGLPLQIILSKVGPKGSFAVAHVSRQLNRLVDGEIYLWSCFCREELDLLVPLDPLGNQCPSFMVAYRTWRATFHMYEWPLVGRVKRVWDKLKRWLSENFPEALATLLPGASENKLDDLESKLGLRLPVPTRLLYRFHNGQGTGGELSMSPTDPHDLRGLIGGYTIFNKDAVNVCLLPTSNVLHKSRMLVNRYKFPTRRYVVVASSGLDAKRFIVDCDDGRLYVSTRNFQESHDMLPCVPDRLINGQDAMLLWLEEHARRLETGDIRLRVRGKNAKSICLFPERAPLCSLSITSGVQVRASAVFAPEFSDLAQEQKEYYFVYSIRMSLQPGMPFSSCQVDSSRFITRANDNVLEEDTDGVAKESKYPLLRLGMREFACDNSSLIPATQGTVHGFLGFYPGSLKDKKGGHFEVEVAEFPLEFPEYIF